MTCQESPGPSALRSDGCFVGNCKRAAQLLAPVIGAPPTSPRPAGISAATIQAVTIIPPTTHPTTTIKTKDHRVEAGSNGFREFGICISFPSRMITDGVGFAFHRLGELGLKDLIMGGR